MTKIRSSEFLTGKVNYFSENGLRTVKGNKIQKNITFFGRARVWVGNLGARLGFYASVNRKFPQLFSALHDPLKTSCLLRPPHSPRPMSMTFCTQRITKHSSQIIIL